MVPLESNQIFSQLAPGELAPIKQAMRQRRFNPGQTVFKEGDAGDGAYVVESGSVEISVVVGSQDERKVFAVEGPGGLFGEMAIVDDQPRSASAIARDHAVVCFVPRETILEAMRGSPRFMSSLMQGITRRLRDFNHQYVQETIQTERLALVGRFTRSIIHDLKNPLSVITVALDTAASDQSTSYMRQLARSRALKQIDRILNLVNEVFEFTRSSNSNPSLTPARYDRLVDHLLDELQPELELRGVRLKLVNDPPAERVMLNAARLSRVFHNLFVNAMDAMRGPDMVVALEFAVRDGRILTTVSDNGPGIAPEVADTLFTAFVTHGKPNGTGLGLSICKRIVEDHRGEIWAGPAPGGGAAFTFALPISPAVPAGP
jgi:signal transduction histidine kinase